MFSYPRISEIETPCDNVSCHGGQTNTNGVPGSCTRCGGSGYVTVQSPYKVYKKKIDSGVTDPEVLKNLLAAPPVSFHTPEVSILNYSKDSWKEYLAMAEEAVYIQQKRLTGNVESAKAKDIDKEGEYSWTRSVSHALHSDLKKVLQAFEDYLNPRGVEVSLDEPTSFALVTEAEAFEALSYIIGSEAPVMVKAQQVDNFVHKYINKSSPFIKALEVLKLLDPLLYYSNKEAQSFKASGVITPAQWAVHVYAYPVIMQMYQKDKTVFTQDAEALAEKAKAELEKFMPPETALKTAILGALENA
jgi:hypothetical protein